MNGSRVVTLIAFGAALAATVLAASAPAGRAAAMLEETRGGVTIDWAAGTLTAQGGAAADHRMPSADLARPGAVRRARAAAIARLKASLAELPLGGDRKLTAAAVERALGRARAAAVDYQSNGGAIVKLVIRFSDWLEPTAPSTPDAAISSDGAQGESAPPDGSPVIAMAAGRLAAAPVIKVGKREGPVGAAIYRVGVPPSATRAIPAKADRSGRLTLEGDAALMQKLAGAVVVIYVQKVTR